MFAANFIRTGSYWLAKSLLVLLPGLMVAPIQSLAQESTTPESSTEEDSGPTNHLADETSLYLLTHANNPVDWYPWGAEALEKAKAEDKPIFLSIGYSSCHWCHVMEDESFKDEKIAKLLNENFVCIKVDREERPDIDMIYMTGFMAYMEVNYPGRRSRGGWPLSVFLTPDKRPFYAGTYIPAHDGDRGVRAGFLSISRNISRIWKTNPDQIRNDADRVTKRLESMLDASRQGDGSELDADWVEQAIVNLKQSFDAVHGGFEFSMNRSDLPKFPRASRLDFLIHQAWNRDDGMLKKDAREILKVTLDRMMLGGIRDHLGGGFHRYSVDRFWHIPHFEKMLYDNGQMASLYAEASALFDDEEYRVVTRELVDFVLREMTDEQGGFYSAIDADSEGEEGAYYRWKKSEIEALLNEEQMRLIEKVYGLNGSPNFEDDYFVLFLTLPLDQLAVQMEMELSDLREQVDAIRQRLLEARRQRPHPLTDDKVLCSWNGMMIRGMADAGRILDEAVYRDAAARAGNFIWDQMRDEQGRLYRTYSRGQAKLNGYVDDYAFLIDGYLALYKATDDRIWVERAVELQKLQDELYLDEKSGGYFFTSDDHEELLVRSRKTFDRAIPAANSVTVQNLVQLAELTGDKSYLERAEKTARSVAGLVRSFPVAATRMLIGIDELLRN